MSTLSALLVAASGGIGRGFDVSADFTENCCLARSRSSRVGSINGVSISRALEYRGVEWVA